VLRAHGVTDKGRVRPVNEDCWAFEAAQGLCVVADGLGGHNAGEVAARVAVETVVTFLTTRTADNDWPFGFDPALSAAGNRLRTAIQLAHMQVLETAITSQRYFRNGHDVVASLVEGNRLSVGTLRRQPALRACQRSPQAGHATTTRGMASDARAQSVGRRRSIRGSIR
jgi:protein phosphatase